ncbi:MAG TPA: methyltransferase domain-containing protein [Steroidobacteraceae bacterium]|nr:methyltransferase domain-containing protein [Steroidobacteraceae bacterium]
MRIAEGDKTFAGSIPEIYDAWLVPLIFAPFAIDLAARVAALQPAHVLELAAGTGAVTRRLAQALPVTTEIVATDLNQPMIDRAAVVRPSRPVTWRQADAQRLPFPDATFDCVVCQFGVMFFPDKPAAFAEARRVLKPGGRLLFNTWDRIEANEFTAAVVAALAQVYPQNPPDFLARVPHGYFDHERLRRDVAAGGFTAPVDIEVVSARSEAASAHVAAVGLCQGTPMRSEIEARGGVTLEQATAAAERALVACFGAGAISGALRAHVVSVAR